MTAGTLTASVPDVRCRIWTVMLFAVTLFRVSAAPVTLAEIPFEFREGLLWIEVAVPQSDTPLHFLLDTGAGASVINLDAAKRLGLSLGSPISVSSVRASMTGYRLPKLSATTGGMALPSDFLALDLSRLSSSCEQSVDGLLGADFFKGRIVQIDFRAQKIRLLKANEVPRDPSAVPLETRRCGMCVMASVNGGKPQRLRLDTGCATALQWVTASVPLERCTSKVAIGLAELSIPQTQTVVSLAGQTFRDVPTGLHREAIFDGESGLLGNGLLARFDTVTIDSQSKRLSFGRVRETQ